MTLGPPTRLRMQLSSITTSIMGGRGRARVDVRAGHRVLEVGTGTGWNAALLAHRLGAGNVVSVEVDGRVAGAARKALERFGAPVHVVHGDGAEGCAPRAPYDRAIATCGLRAVPAAWLRVRDCRQLVARKEGDARPVWLYSLSDRSWACAQFRDGGPTRVWQYGRRRLWDEAEAAHGWWQENGRPGHDRFGLTVGADGHRAWLDDPSHAWPL